MPTKGSSFAARVIQFYEENPGWSDGDMVVTSPWVDPDRRAAIEAFYKKFFSDNNPRTYILGINPGRFVVTSTGIPYTDGQALAETCGIENAFSKSREMVASFFEEVVKAYGGAKAFYADIYAGAVFPFEILVNDKYRNYYDDDVWDQLKGPILDLLPKVAEFGSNGRVVILGSGENQRQFKKLNEKLGLFEVVGVIDHPRYIMQYKRDQLEGYVQRYLEALKPGG